jgi:mono/diheme cytochrome c family protein
MAIRALFFAALLLIACGAPATAPTAVTTEDLLARGASLYHAMGCAGCHEINGVGRKTGPPLDHIGSTAATRRPGMSAETYLRQSLLDPYAYLVPGYEDFVQRSWPTEPNSAELSALVAFLMSLK